MAKHSVQLDIAHEGESLEAALASMVEPFRHDDAGMPTYEVVNASGPGGGWPVVEFSSTSGQQLYALLLAYCGGNDEDADYINSAHVAYEA